MLSVGVSAVARASAARPAAVNGLSFFAAAGSPAAAFFSSTTASLAYRGVWTAPRRPLRMSSPSTGCPSITIGSSSAWATSSQKVRSTCLGVVPRPYSPERSAAHPVHRSKAGSAPHAHHWTMPRQASAGSTALSSTNRSARRGNICV